MCTFVDGVWLPEEDDGIDEVGDLVEVSPLDGLLRAIIRVGLCRKIHRIDCGKIRQKSLQMTW